MADSLHIRVEAIKGTLVGERVRIEVPYEGGVYAAIGIVTRVAFPLVEVDTGGGQTRLRHVNDIDLTD